MRVTVSNPNGAGWSRPGGIRLRRFAAMTVVVLGVLASAGCGPQRSVAAYCKTFYGEGQKIRTQAQQAATSNDPLQQLAEVLGSPAQLYQLFKKLDKVAPDDIQPDVETLRDSFKQQADSLGGATGSLFDNPFGGLVSGLVRGLSTAGAAQRVDSWTQAHCGPPPNN